MNQEGNSGNSGRNLFSTAVLVVILIVLLIVGYLIVDTLNALRQPLTGVSGAVGTQVQQVLNPTPTIIADPVTVIRQIQSLSRMETSSFTIEKVITAESGEGTFGFLFSDKLLLVAQGQVIAGIDMALMGEGDVRVVADTVYITMPASEIFVATLDNDATYVYDRQTGLLAQQQIDLETLARREAENQILIAALEGGILDMAQTNGQNYIQTLMQALGFQEVVFVTATPAPDQDRGRDSTP